MQLFIFVNPKGFKQIKFVSYISYSPLIFFIKTRIEPTDKNCTNILLFQNVSKKTRIENKKPTS